MIKKRKLGKTDILVSTIQFGYSQKVNRPGRRTISPFPRNTFDISRIRNGNPYLDPQSWALNPYFQ